MASQMPNLPLTTPDNSARCQQPTVLNQQSNHSCPGSISRKQAPRPVLFMHMGEGAGHSQLEQHCILSRGLCKVLSHDSTDGASSADFCTADLLACGCRQLPSMFAVIARTLESSCCRRSDFIVHMVGMGEGIICIQQQMQELLACPACVQGF
ncbi:TPA: hypothetical protein ACH3X2_009665 [Trebouxia sp. C0005]